MGSPSGAIRRGFIRCGIRSPSSSRCPRSGSAAFMSKARAATGTTVPLPAGDGDRNAIPLYRFAEPRVVYHFIESMPIRVSALRGLGAYANVFSIESFMDELARKAGVDPVVYRRRQLTDPRARDVIDTAA